MRPVTSRRRGCPLFGGDLQAARHLGGQTHQDVRVHLDQLAEFLVGNFEPTSERFSREPGAALTAFFEQSELADEIPG